MPNRLETAAKLANGSTMSQEQQARAAANKEAALRRRVERASQIAALPADLTELCGSEPPAMISDHARPQRPFKAPRVRM